MSVSVLGREQLVQNLSKFKKDLVDRLVSATEMTQAAVQADARSRHGHDAHAQGRFITHSGGLEQSINPARVKLTDKFIEGEVVARMPYASYVEQGTSRNRPFPFLAPALIAQQEPFKARLRTALKGATGG
jgi:HK97 gp10 family phage protein